MSRKTVETIAMLLRKVPNLQKIMEITMEITNLNYVTVN